MVESEWSRPGRVSDFPRFTKCGADPGGKSTKVYKQLHGILYQLGSCEGYRSLSTWW